MTSPFSPGALVCAYLRDSGGDQQELSIPQQRATLATFATANSLAITQTFVDAARPGSTTIGRDGFHAMMDHFRRSAPEAGLIIWSYSRFSRDFDDAAFYRADLRRRGYLLHSLSDPIPDGNLGRLFEAIIDWKNQTFLEDLSRDVSRGLANLVSTYGAVPGRPPVGFVRAPVQIGTRRDGTPHIGHRWQPDPRLAPIIRQAFELRAAGIPLQQIHDQTRLYKTINCYATFFANPLYKGLLIYGGQQYPDYCAPIVDADLWQAAQRKQRQIHPRRQHSRYLLSGLAFCARCGAPLSGLTRSGHQSYACSRQHPHKQCDLQPIPAKPLERTVISTLIDHILTPENLSAQRHNYLAGQVDRQAEIASLRQRSRANLITLDRQIDNTTGAIADLGGSPALLDKLRTLELDRANLQAELHNLDRQQTTDLLSLDDLVLNSEHIKNALLSDHDSAQTALRGLVQRLTIDRDGRVVTGMITCFFD